MMSLNEIIAFLYKRENFLQHCSDRDINKLESKYNIKLPAVYKDFLIEMGRGADEFMLGSSYSYEKLFSMQDSAKELLEENNFRQLPLNSFVFWMHQGYQFAFFLLDDGDDPPIYHFDEVTSDTSNNEFVLLAQSFTKFLNIELEPILKK